MSAKGSSGASSRQSRPLPRFVHRFNLDGSVDSICSACAKTIATEPAEVALTPAEDSHECDGTLRKPPQRAV